MKFLPDSSLGLIGAEIRNACLFNRIAISIAFAIAAATLVFDLNLPLGVAGGVPYVALILVGIWFSKPWHIIFLATLGSVLIVVGYVSSPDGGISWVVLSNRGLALFAIWITAFVLVLLKRNEEEQINLRTRDLQDKNALVDLLHRVAVAANRSANVEEAMQGCLKEICSYTGWPIGHVYVHVSHPVDRMVPTKIWHLEEEARFSNFRNITEKTEFEPGVGLPGWVYQSGEAVWINDISQAPNFPRAKLTDDIGSYAALGLPVKVGEKTVAVLEFFSTGVEEPDEALMLVVDNIGTQLGRVMERDWAEADMRKLSRAVDQNPASIIITDPNGHIEYANPKFEKITGYSLDEVIGKNQRFLSSGEMSKEEYQVLWDTIISGKEWRGELHNKRKDGSLFWEAVSISPVATPEGEIANFVAIKEDITSLKESEDALRRAQRMEAVGQLTGGIAHDFNNLLAIMGGHVELLERRVSDNSAPDSGIMAIKKAVARGASLTRRLLTFSGKQPLTSATVDINRLINDLEDMFRRTLGEKTDLKIENAKELWMATSDPHQFEDALLNLSINARDAMPGGGVLGIRTANAVLDESYVSKHEGLVPGDYVMVAVSDSGCGMKTDIVDKVFEPFFTTKEFGKGSGLGLSMIYGFVKQSRGHIAIHSEVGRGTTIELYLPRSHSTPAAHEGGDKTVNKERGSEHILVFEDDELVREVPVMILRQQGYEVVEAASGEDAVRQLESGRNFDLLFTDMVLPGGMNGVEIARKAWHIQPHIKVLYTTGYADTGTAHVDQPEMAGWTLHKPYELADLLQKVREVLDDTTA